MSRFGVQHICELAAQDETLTGSDVGVQGRVSVEVGDVGADEVIGGACAGAELSCRVCLETQVDGLGSHEGFYG